MSEREARCRRRSAFINQGKSSLCLAWRLVQYDAVGARANRASLKISREPSTTSLPRQRPGQTQTILADNTVSAPCTTSRVHSLAAHPRPLIQPQGKIRNFPMWRLSCYFHLTPTPLLLSSALLTTRRPALHHWVRLILPIRPPSPLNGTRRSSLLIACPTEM